MRRALVRGALVCALLCACGQTRLTQARPRALIDTRPIDFGTTPVLFPVERDVLATNGGRVPLHLTAIAASGAGFSVGQASLALDPGASAQLRAFFTPPQAGRFSGKLTVQTDDPQTPTAEIDLTGVGALTGAIAVTPLAIDFGRVGEGQTVAKQLSIASTGQADLYLGSIAAAPAGYAIVGSVSTPATLATGQHLTLDVRFSPLPGAEAPGGAVTIDSSDPAQPHLSVPLTGAVNHAPVPVAQASPMEVPVGGTVIFDGSGSTDADGDLPLRYAWSIDAAPVGSAARMSAPGQAQTTLTLDQPGVYSALLAVTDSTGLPSLAPARVDVRAVPPQQLLLQLVWDQIPPDLDLHFLQQGAALDSPGDCYWANPSGWGPIHEGDKLVGYGPETVAWAAPGVGTYDIAVVYADAHGSLTPTTNAQVRVYSQGVLVADLAYRFTHQGEVWRAGTIAWPPGTVQAP